MLVQPLDQSSDRMRDRWWEDALGLLLGDPTVVGMRGAVATKNIVRASRFPTTHPAQSIVINVAMMK